MQILNYNPPTHKTFGKVFFTDILLFSAISNIRYLEQNPWSLASSRYRMLTVCTYLVTRLSYIFVKYSLI